MIYPDGTKRNVRLTTLEGQGRGSCPPELRA